MKRLIAVSAIIVLIALSLIGCKDTESTTSGDAPMPGGVFSDIL